MKIQVLGIKRMTGTAKESGNPFDMCTLFAIVPIEQVNSQKFSVQGYGYEVGEMPVEPTALKQFGFIRQVRTWYLEKYLERK